MRLLDVQQALGFAVCASALNIRDALIAPLNQTTVALWNPAPSQATTESSSSLSKSRFLKPHPEFSVTGFDEPPPSTTQGRDGHQATTTTTTTTTTQPSQPDIGSLIQSFLITAIPASPMPSVADAQKSKDGWQGVTKSAAAGQVSSSVLQVPIPMVTPPPAMTQHHGLTLQPVPAPAHALPSSRMQQGAMGVSDVAVSTTVVAGTTQYLVAGQTLAPGQAVTVDGVSISMGTSAGGHTVLVMGSSTTTLATGTTGGSARSTAAAAWAPLSAAAPTTPPVMATGNNAPVKPAATSAKSNNADVAQSLPWLPTRLLVIAVLARPFV
ncbi:hypothetical protein ACEQ8H_007109 [Pleosporales sp. CAS-2024a]